MKPFEDYIQYLKRLQSNYEVGTGQHNVLGIAINEADQALSLFAISGRSEQLLAFKEWERDKCRLPWDAEPKEIVEQYLSQ